MASARGESLAVTALSSPVAMTFLKPAAVRGTQAPASQGQAVTTSLSRWQGRHPGWRHHCQGQRAAPGRLERAAGGCADRVGPAAGGAAWQRRPALQHRTRGGPVKAGPSPPPRPPPRTGGPLGCLPPELLPLTGSGQRTRVGPQHSQQTLPGVQDRSHRLAGLGQGPASQPHHGVPHPTPKCSGGPPHIPRSRRLSHSPQSPSSLPPSCLCTRP